MKSKQIFMRYISFLTSIVTALVVTNTAIAAAPSSVSALQAEFRDSGGIAVSWEKLEDEEVAFYRVYYSANSILENEGIYDDFESTEGDRSVYVFDSLTPDSDVYVAVLAVNTEGEESEFFSEEILIHIPAAQNIVVDTPIEEVPDVAEESPVEEKPMDEETAPVDGSALQLLGSESVSPTEVRVELSHPIVIRSKGSASLFSITKADGSALAVRTVVSENGSIIVRTDEQMAGTVYELHVNDALGESYHLAIDNDNRATLFTGHPDGTGASVVAEEPAEEEVINEEEEAEAEEEAETEEEEVEELIPEQKFDPNLPLQPIKKLRITYEKAANGLYDVSATWKNAGSLTNALHLVVGQSFDGGKTYSEPQFMPGNALSADIQGIPAGKFGLFIQSMDPIGKVSEGASVNIVLSDEGLMPEEPVLPEAPEEPVELPEEEEEMIHVESSGALPESGAGFVLLTLVFAGAFVGWKFQSGLLKILPVIR